MSNPKSNLPCVSSLWRLRLRGVVAVWIAGVILAWTCAAFGNEFARDAFNYSPAGSQLDGHGGGGSFGFSSNWYKIGDETNIKIGSGNLTSPVPLAPPSGNRVTAAANQGNRWDYRDLSQSLGADNTTTYFSFLMQAQDVVGGGSDNGFFGFYLFAGARQLSIGKSSFQNVYKVEAGPGEIALTNVPVVADETHLFVLRANFQAGTDVYRLFIDPLPGQPEPAVANATLSNFDMLGMVTTIGVGGPGAFGFDELRIGTTWNDVTPVPEPSSFVLLSLGAVGLFLAARRRSTG